MNKKILNITDECFGENYTIPTIDDENNKNDLFLTPLTSYVPGVILFLFSLGFIICKTIRRLLYTKLGINFSNRVILLDLI